LYQPALYCPREDPRASVLHGWRKFFPYFLHNNNNNNKTHRVANISLRSMEFPSTSLLTFRSTTGSAWRLSDILPSSSLSLSLSLSLFLLWRTLTLPHSRNSGRRACTKRTSGALRRHASPRRWCGEGQGAGGRGQGGERAVVVASGN